MWQRAQSRPDSESVRYNIGHFLFVGVLFFEVQTL